MTQILDQVFQFAAGERVVGFHGMTADGFGNGMFSQPQGIDFPPGGFEFVHQFQRKSTRISGPHERWQGIEQKSALAKLAQPNP